MKKLLGIVVLGLLWCNISFADDGHLDDFNKWLFENGHTQYVQRINICNFYKKHSKEWFDHKCENYPKGRLMLKNNQKIKVYNNRWTLPEKWQIKSNPNFGTLLYYYYKYNFSHFTNDPITKQWDRYEVKPSNNSIEFDKDLIDDKYINKKMQKTSLLSYLLYENSKISIDKLSPNDRFGPFVTNETKLRSMSIGKTMVSYVMGHAICKGYINSINSTIGDWSLVNNTLYQDQKIIDLLNMSAGDQKYLERSDFKDGGDTDTLTALEAMLKMSNKKKSNKKFNYNGLLPHLLLNYILYKTGDDFELLLNDIFQNDVKIKNSIYFYKHPNRSKEVGNANSMFFATRYDYLRIAKTMLDDWNNDTCVGQYLKDIYESRVAKKNKYNDNTSPTKNSKSYAGFFHTDYSGMSERPVMGMDGYGGQSIMIDFDNDRIVVIHSVNRNYNWKKIAHSVIKKGK